RRREGAIVFRNAIVGGQRVASEDAADQCGHDDGEDHGGEWTGTSHDGILSDNLLINKDFLALLDPLIPLTPPVPIPIMTGIARLWSWESRSLCLVRLAHPS